MLARMRKSMDEKDQGFTLIELLVVMIIIGILAAIAIPVFLNQRKKAVDTGVKSDVTSAGKNLASYYVDSTAGALYAAVSSGSLLIGTTSGGSDVANQKLSNANTTLVTAGTNGVGYIASCSIPTAWYVALKNTTDGSGSTWYYSASGLTSTVPSTCPTS